MRAMQIMRLCPSTAILTRRLLGISVGDSIRLQTLRLNETLRTRYVIALSANSRMMYVSIAY